jgi:hypothetical protein
MFLFPPPQSDRVNRTFLLGLPPFLVIDSSAMSNRAIQKLVTKSLGRVALVVAGALLFMAPKVSAAPILWTLQNVGLSDGATVSGSFVFDASLAQFSSVTVSLTAGSANPAETFAFFSPVTQLATNLYLDISNPIVVGTTEGLFINFAPQLTNAGGTVSVGGILGPCSTAICGNISSPQAVVSTANASAFGVAVSPEPSTLSLILLGTLVVFILRHRILKQASRRLM